MLFLNTAEQTHVPYVISALSREIKTNILLQDYLKQKQRNT